VQGSKRARKVLRVIAAGAILAVGVAILVFAINSQQTATRDYAAYWAAGQQLVHHQNPYDGAAIHRIQKEAGYQWDFPLFMRNTPLAFFIAYPLGFFGERSALCLWVVVLILSLVASTHMLRAIAGDPPDRTHLLAYVFPPVIACLSNGQLGIILLLGITTFLRFHRTNPLLAGIALIAIAVKPHLFLPFGVALLMWCLFERQLQILVGAALAIVAALAFSLIIDPQSWMQYQVMIRAEGIERQYIPCFSMLFRMLVNRNSFWLQFVPCAIATAYAAIVMFKRHREWRWEVEGCNVLALSVMVAPYAWFVDEAVVLPAVLLNVYRASFRYVIVLGFLMAAVLIEVACGAQIPSNWYVWTATAWYLWCIGNTRSADAPVHAMNGKDQPSARAAETGVNVIASTEP